MELPAVSTFTAEYKASLVNEALDVLRGAHAIDERETLSETEAVAWYDRVGGQVTDIKVLAGAMEVEMHKRRGEHIAAEGERRGGDHGNRYSSKVTPGVTLLEAERQAHSRDRVLAEEAETVDAYVKEEVEAGRPPTVKQAVGRARRARKRMTKTAAGKARSGRLKGSSEIARLRKAVVYAAVDKLASLHGETRLSDAELHRRCGIRINNFLPRVQFIEWVHIDRTEDGTIVRIDANLRAICEGRRPRPELNGLSLFPFLRQLRGEIIHRRKVNKDEREKRRWNHEAFAKREQSDLLDYIEAELDKVPE